jgi:hypothetical protein
MEHLDLEDNLFRWLLSVDIKRGDEDVKEQLKIDSALRWTGWCTKESTVLLTPARSFCGAAFLMTFRPLYIDELAQWSS